jgi:hypothetical protein
VPIDPAAAAAASAAAAAAQLGGYGLVSTEFGLSVILPHSMLRSVISACHVDPSAAVVRFQLRWYDTVDEDAVQCVGDSVDTGCLPSFGVPGGAGTTAMAMDEAGFVAAASTLGCWFE